MSIDDQKALREAYQDLNRAMRVYQNDSQDYLLSNTQERNARTIIDALNKKFPDNEDLMRILTSTVITTDIARTVLNMAYCHLGMAKLLD